MNVKVAMATGAILMVMDLLNFFFPPVSMVSPRNGEG